MDARDLECVTALSRTGHFGRAAHALGISQPSLSRRVAALEDAVGSELFVRSTHGVRTTAAGAAFVAHAGRALGEIEAAMLDADHAARRWSGSVRLGFTGSSMIAVLPPVLARFRRQHPRVQLLAHEMTSARCGPELVSGHLDVAVTRGPPRCSGADQLLTVAIGAEDLVVVLPRDHRLASRESVRPEQLAGEALITTPPTHEDPVLPAPLLALGVPALSHVHNAHTLMTLVACGVGLGLGPGSMRRIGIPEVRFAAMDPAARLPRLALSVRRDNRDPAVATLLRSASDLLPTVARLLPAAA